NGWIPSITFWQQADLSARGASCSSYNFTPEGLRESIFPSPRQLLIKIRLPSASRRRFQEVRRWNAGSRAWFGGTRWLWWYVPIKWKAASGDISQLLPPRPPYTKLRLITSCTRALRTGTAILF